MGAKSDQAKGRVEEAAGNLTGNAKLKHDGTADRIAGEVKEKVEDIVDAVKKVIHKVEPNKA